MSLPSERFAQLRWLQNLTCVIAALGGLGLVGLGLMRSGSPTGTGGAWFIAAGAFLIFIAVITMTFVPLVLKIESHLSRQYNELRDLNESLGKQQALLETITENTRISDAAKSLAHRTQELDALRGAIREEQRNDRWEPAMNLIDEMERRFGYKDEAECFREELDAARTEAIEGKLREAVEIVESHFGSYDWARAQGEIDRLLHALPDNPKVLALQDRMKIVREEHKQELLLAWQEAVRRNDTDHAIDVLRELDQYLSPTEAQALQSSARNVFKEKLLQLGVQFRFAVQEKRWQDALDSGLELIREFPNARMAGEVREALDTLRERARTVAEAEPAGA